ncbi:MAG TPA: VanZ family protein [Bryobacteraceae bacterium]|nr:VanZ family protein [Bryobacteraceae bacterium]
MAWGCLYPWHFASVPLAHNPLWILLHSWPSHFDLPLLRDVAVNVVIYVPAGLTGHLAFRRRGYRWLAYLAPVAICAAFSATIEMIQLWVPSRDTSLLDFVTNVSGTLAGVILAVFLEDFSPARTSSGKPVDRSALALLGSGFLWMLFPLMPILGRTALRYKFSVFRHARFFDPIAILSMAMVWFAAGELLDASRLPAARKLILFSLLVLPMRFLIVGQIPLPAEMIGAILGAVAYSKLGSPNRWITAGVFLVTIAARGLTPFVFTRQSLPFSWIPFTGFLAIPWQRGVIVAAEKFYWYGTAVWLLRRARCPKPAALAIVVGMLLAIEIAQIHLPAHFAEITDPLLGLAAGWSIFVLAER